MENLSIDKPKGLIIISKNFTGASNYAEELASENGPYRTIKADVVREGGYEMFQDWCFPATKTVIIEAVGKNFRFETFFNVIGGLDLQTRDGQPYSIYPKFIFVTTFKPRRKDASFLKRFEIKVIDDSLPF